MVLKLGSTIPTECEKVGNLLIRPFKNDGNILALDNAPESSLQKGKVLLSSREMDYQNHFASADLNICDTIFSKGKLLKLKLKQGGEILCSAPYTHSIGVHYPVGYAGLVESSHNSYLASGVGIGAATTHIVSFSYAGRSWRLVEYNWFPVRYVSGTLATGTVDFDGSINIPDFITHGAFFHSPPHTDGEDAAAIDVRIEVECNGIWPDPPLPNSYSF